MTNDLRQRIEINPKVMLGKPVIKGTRITVENILKKLSQNISAEKILEDYPKLSKQDIQAAIAYAAEAMIGAEKLLLRNKESRIPTKRKQSVRKNSKFSKKEDNPLKGSIVFEHAIITPIDVVWDAQR